jgi:hypothetical protein
MNLQMLVQDFSFLFFSSLPNLHEVVQRGHNPLLIQKGCAHAGQKVEPRRVGQSAAPDSSTALSTMSDHIYNAKA